MPKISEERKEARRQEILEVATRCFARQGFHRTTMEDIISALHSSPGAVYCYFRGKDDIVAAIAEQRHSRESAFLTESLATGSVSEGIAHLASRFFEILQDPKEMERRKVTIQLWAESLRDQRIRKIIERGIRQRDLLTAALRRAQASSQLPEDLDVDALSRVLLGILQGFILQQAWEPALDSQAYLATVLRLVESVFIKSNTEKNQGRRKNRKAANAPYAAADSERGANRQAPEPSAIPKPRKLKSRR